MELETVKEDAVECWIFINTPTTSCEDFLIQIRETLSNLTKNYLWHKDCFNVHLPVTPSDVLPPHLYSLTFYGDNIEDEWFIVYVLTELTRRHPGAVVQVRDNDGEILLIEAADSLPAWAKPDTTHNRVFIFNGEVHLIPPDLLDIKHTPSLKTVIEFLNKSPNVTRAADNIQAAIRYRIQSYPQSITTNLHRATVTMPAKFATLLKVEPSLISQAVNAYCNRDTLESKVCKNMVLENCVDTSVTFTKCLYAMLIHASMINIPSWRLPAKSSKDYKKNMLGVKLACGFEILISKESHNVFATKQWQTYLDNLKKNCYFKENIEGSKDYTNLLENAQQYYISNECSNINSHIGNVIKQIMSTTQYDQAFKSIAQSVITEDKESDDWLNINSENLNNMISERYGKVMQFSRNENITPQTITDHLSAFLTRPSDLEGIELDENNYSSEISGANEDHIEFNYEQFTEKVKSILDSVVPKDDTKLDSDTDLSEFCSDDEITPELEQPNYQQAMDEELLSSTMSQSFVKDGKDLNISKNVFMNLLHSVKEEKGSSGPSSNLLGNIGFSKNSMQPLDSDDEDAES